MYATALGQMKQFGATTLGSAGNLIANQAQNITGAGSIAGGAAASTAQEMAGIQNLIAQANQQLARLNAGAA
jgi:hypothetical protein